MRCVRYPVLGPIFNPVSQHTTLLKHSIIGQDAAFHLRMFWSTSVAMVIWIRRAFGNFAVCDENRLLHQLFVKLNENIWTASQLSWDNFLQLIALVATGSNLWQLAATVSFSITNNWHSNRFSPCSEKFPKTSRHLITSSSNLIQMMVCRWNCNKRSYDTPGRNLTDERNQMPGYGAGTGFHRPVSPCSTYKNWIYGGAHNKDDSLQDYARFGVVSISSEVFGFEPGSLRRKSRHVSCSATPSCNSMISASAHTQRHWNATSLK